MAGPIGMACTLLGALAIYLASPNQLAIARPLPRRALTWGGGMALLIGLVLLLQWAGPATAVFIHVTLAMLVWTFTPVTAAWLRASRKPAR